MSPIGETPSSVLYADLRTFGGISNRDAASMLLSDDVVIGGKTPRSRVDSRTYLSREVVHVTPDRVFPGIFADFSISCQTLYGRLLARHDFDELLDHYGGIAAGNMIGSLQSFGLDARVYRNETTRLKTANLQRAQDRPLLLFMLFCITGCLANVQRATQLVEEFAQRMLTLDIGTITTVPAPTPPTVVGAGSLGLLRIVNGVARPPIYPLEAAGSVIGAHAVGPGAVTDVGPDVSRLHARVWREGDQWLCEGLSSTNGTSVVRGSDGSLAWVEPPRGQRAYGQTFPPVEINEGDTLYLGHTCYLVMRIQVPGAPGASLLR